MKKDTQNVRELIKSCEIKLVKLDPLKYGDLHRGKGGEVDNSLSSPSLRNKENDSIHKEINDKTQEGKKRHGYCGKIYTDVTIDGVKRKAKSAKFHPLHIRRPSFNESDVCTEEDSQEFKRRKVDGENFKEIPGGSTKTITITIEGVEKQIKTAKRLVPLCSSVVCDVEANNAIHVKHSNSKGNAKEMPRNEENVLDERPLDNGIRDVGSQVSLEKHGNDGDERIILSKEEEANELESFILELEELVQTLRKKLRNLKHEINYHDKN